MPRHAPKGRIKGSDPMLSANPLARRCTAHSKQSGNPCKQMAVPGATVCRFHGGAAPQVKAKALERLMALQHPAIDTLEYLMGQRRTFPSTAYAAARDVLDRTEGKAVETVRQDITVNVESELMSRLMGARRRTDGHDRG